MTYVNIWKGFGFFGVCLLAALQTVPPELYDAAAVDGASPWNTFMNVTLPCIKDTVLVTVLSTIWTMNDFQSSISLQRVALDIPRSRRL